MKFPDALPSPLRSGYGFKPENNIIRTQMVSGRARQRVAYTSVPTYAPLSWIFDQVQAEIFEAFAAQVGGGWFSMRLKAPVGFYEMACRFTETPVGPELVGQDLWGYKAQVEVRERPMLDKSYGLTPDLVVKQNIVDVALNQEWPE
ncbi:hypothetical protein KP003_16625 [Geomonas nitrogeniifigens]|uniref:hypothetical protein n=1 Tax=Geomonas diazotrophica TaxID=2843197 RepID=UPI001C2C6299|nr:hypothetical protein [Geomonas nitrogeniifigens]QXE85966.1 hypothetical protein KP003_16625 [Geomonas nitrogeniifigens]